MGPHLTRLPPGPHGLLSARPEPDLAAHGYEEHEYLLTGTAMSFAGSMPADGRARFTTGDVAAYATRVVVRSPDPHRASGTLFVEWLNVSSGSDAAPDWNFVHEELLRSGHAWAGVSAQFGGVEGGMSSVAVGDLGAPGLRGADPDRYGSLHHPGDAYCYDIYTQAAEEVRDLLGAERVVAIGESQSACTLTTYANGVQPLSGLFDGFLVHSRPAVAAPLGAAGTGLLMDDVLRSHPCWIRPDTDVPVLVVQAEGDLFDRMGYLPARQPDSDRFRLWEVAGAAHADRYVIGEFEEFLGCPGPVNRGQQWAVVRAAVRSLHRWIRDDVAPPTAPRIEATPEDAARDAHGIARGGVRTPVVDAPAELNSGRPWPGSSTACRLFGSSAPLDPPAFTDADSYLAAYAAATDTAVGAGFVLEEDREAVLAEARPELIASPAHHAEP